MHRQEVRPVHSATRRRVTEATFFGNKSLDPTRTTVVASILSTEQYLYDSLLLLFKTAVEASREDWFYSERFLTERITRRSLRVVEAECDVYPLLFS